MEISPAQRCWKVNMPISRKERHERYKNKLESDPDRLAAHREKDRERKKSERAELKKKMTEKQKAEIRHANRERKRKERQRKAKEKNSIQTPC